MRFSILDIYRLIVGPEEGYTGEGIEQWYYFVSLMINAMLVWWFKPEIALCFTILMVIHYLTVAIYGYFDLVDAGKFFAYIYIIVHIVLLVVAASICLKWAVITSAITIGLYMLSKLSVFYQFSNLRTPYDEFNIFLFFNTIVFASWIIIDFLLPIGLWAKVWIFFIGMFLHPIIDVFEGEGIIISDVTEDIYRF